jgi:transcription antitermination factor NusG
MIYTNPQSEQDSHLHHAALLEQWYVAYIVTKHEKVVAEQLRWRSIEAFLPLYRTVHYWNKRRADVELPLFPSYVFVHISTYEKLRVLKIPSVVHIVSFNGVPAPVPNEEIEALRAALSLRRYLPYPYLSAGKRIRIKAGPLKGLEGVFTYQKSSARVIVSVDFIQRSVSIELEPCDLACLP